MRATVFFFAPIRLLQNSLLECHNLPRPSAEKALRHLPEPCNEAQTLKKSSILAASMQSQRTLHSTNNLSSCLFSSSGLSSAVRQHASPHMPHPISRPGGNWISV